VRLLRTPDERFDGLPDFDFEPHYATVAGEIRVHYLDEGPRDSAPVVLLHGEPSWSFLYRKVIPVLLAAGHRVIVPDLVGFGRSDKPADRADCTYQGHVEWMEELLLTHLEVRDATLVAQDWGGLIGLRALADAPERFARAVVANTGLPTGDQPMSEAFLAWQRFSQTAKGFDIGRIVANGCAEPLAPEVVAAYDAPFPDDTFKEAARIFPSLVPTSPDDPAAAANRHAWTVLERWEGPFLCAFSDRGPITAGGAAPFLRRVPGAARVAPVTIVGGGHFLQEDRGPELGRAVADFIAATPTGALA